MDFALASRLSTTVDTVADNSIQFFVILDAPGVHRAIPPGLPANTAGASGGTAAEGTVPGRASATVSTGAPMVEPRGVRPGIYVATPVYGAACYMPYVNRHALASAGLSPRRGAVCSTILRERHGPAARAAQRRGRRLPPPQRPLAHALHRCRSRLRGGGHRADVRPSRRTSCWGPIPPSTSNWGAVVAAARRDPALFAGGGRPALGRLQHQLLRPGRERRFRGRPAQRDPRGRAG